MTHNILYCNKISQVPIKLSKSKCNYIKHNILYYIKFHKSTSNSQDQNNKIS